MYLEWPVQAQDKREQGENSFVDARRTVQRSCSDESRRHTRSSHRRHLCKFKLPQIQVS